MSAFRFMTEEELIRQLREEWPQLVDQCTERKTMTEFEKMIQLLDAAWLLRGEIVPCLVGPPGIGKTAAVEQHAKAHHCGKVVKIVASRCVPSETVGMTMPDHKHRSMEIYNSMQLSSLEDGDILFLDELLEADQFVLSTLLTVIESREMADGTPLPDIQIIAATNDTIPPEQLKGNIRQRFMFQRFKIDEVQTKLYIHDKTGMDIKNSLLLMMTDASSDYNFLTPRSLTKLCMWIDAAPKEIESEVANVIDSIWNCTIGTDILFAKRERDSKLASPEEQVRAAVCELVPPCLADENDGFKDCTIPEMMRIIEDAGLLESIVKELAKLDIEKDEEVEADIKF